MSILEKLTKKQRDAAAEKKAEEDRAKAAHDWEAEHLAKAKAKVKELLSELDGHRGIKVKFFGASDQYGSFAAINKGSKSGTVHVCYEAGTFRGSDESPSQDTWDLHIYLTTQYLNGPREIDCVAWNDEDLLERFEDKLADWLVKNY